jgi:hypothetical protein
VSSCINQYPVLTLHFPCLSYMISGDCINTSLNNTWGSDVMINTNRRDVIIFHVKQHRETFFHIEKSLFSIISEQVIGSRTVAVTLYNDHVSIVDVINPFLCCTCEHFHLLAHFSGNRIYIVWKLQIYNACKTWSFALSEKYRVLMFKIG